MFHPFEGNGGWLKGGEIGGRNGAAVEDSEKDVAGEVVDAVDADADTRAAGTLGGEADFGGKLKLVVDVVAEFRAVVDHGDVLPLVEGVEAGTVDEGLGTGGGSGEGIETPLVAEQARFEQEAVGGAVFLEVEEALLGAAAGGGTKNNFPGKCFGAGEGVVLDEEGVGGAMEANGFAAGGVDELGFAFDGGGVSAEAVEAIEAPELGLRLSGEGER